MDVQMCNECNAVNPAYVRFCEKCDAEMLGSEKSAENENKKPEEQSTMFQSADLDDESTQSKKIDSVLIGIVATLTLFWGGWLWLLVSGIIYLPFRKQDNSWAFFMIPWVLIQIVGALIVLT